MMVTNLAVNFIYILYVIKFMCLSQYASVEFIILTYLLQQFAM